MRGSCNAGGRRPAVECCHHVPEARDGVGARVIDDVHAVREAVRRRQRLQMRIGCRSGSHECARWKVRTSPLVPLGRTKTSSICIVTHRAEDLGLDPALVQGPLRVRGNTAARSQQMRLHVPVVPDVVVSE